MQYWTDGAALTLIAIAVLLALVWALSRLVPGLSRAGVPLSIVAGVAGLLLGDQVLSLFSLDTALLESVVYHGLAVVFIAVGLKAPAGGGRTAGTRPMAFAIVAMLGGQATLGLLAVTLLDPTLHPGVGLLLPMGFEEGPGQALSMGAAWSMEDGAQIGLIIAVIGYAWAVVAGVPLAMWGRRRGWASSSEAPDDDAGDPAPTATAAGSLDALTVQVGIIAACYLLTFGICRLLATLLAGMPEIAAMIWGFHFIIGAGVAMLARPLVGRLPGPVVIDDGLMGQICGLTVDVVTCAALSAVQIAVLRAHWLPIAVITTTGGLWTLVFAVFMGRRAWQEASFEHTVLWFGMSAGTLPTGLALLKVVDPELKSPAAVSAVFGSAAATVGLAPLMLVLIPAAVTTHGDASGARWLWLFALLSYWLLVIGLWRAVGGLRFRYRADASRAP